MAIRHNQHARAEPDFVGRGGEKGQRVENIEPRRLSVDRKRHLLDVVAVVLGVGPRRSDFLRIDDVVAGQNGIKRPFLGNARHFQELFAAANLRAARQM
jgi:hypothetical protein